MTVKDILKSKGSEVVTTKTDTAVLQSMALLIERHISCLPVVDNNRLLVGIISEKDIFRSAYRHPADFTQQKVGDIMTKDVIVGLESDEVSYIAAIMTKNRIRHIPIVDGINIVGMVSVGDVVKTQIQSVEIENRYLRDYIEGKYPG